MKKIYSFLGGVYFAIILISALATCVIAGTFIESAHDSHLQAAEKIYGHPLFLLLLSGFFINILLSALRRWPFRKAHIPFLITHLGLLMIISGTAIKQIWGIQGAMVLLEGATADTLIISNTQALYLEKKDPHTTQIIPVRKIPNSTVTPHSTKKINTWFKDDLAYINGLSPLKIAAQSPVTKVKIHGYQSDPWDVYVIQSNTILQTAREIYVQGITVSLKNSYTGETLLEGSLHDLLENGAKLGLNEIHAELNWDFTNPELRIWGANHQFEVGIPLMGDRATENINLQTPYLGSSPITIDLQRTPSLVLLKSEDESASLFAFDPYGRISYKAFPINDLSSIIVYDEGFGGYAVQWEIPFAGNSQSRQEMRNSRIASLGQELRNGLSEDPTLSPPLAMLADASAQCDQDFIDSILLYLDYWDRTGHWLFPDNYPLPGELIPIMETLDWKKLNPDQKSVCEFISELFYRLEPELLLGLNPQSVLKEHEWPFLNSISGNEKETLNTLTQQIIVAIQHSDFPIEDTPLTLGKKARLLSAYLRACNVHLADITPNNVVKEQNLPRLEASLKPVYTEAPPLKKLEDNLPFLTVHLGGEKIQLGFDPIAQGLKWPTLNGSYLLRFQPETVTLPYQVKLHSAKQWNYPGTNQAYSYECQIRFTDKRNRKKIDTMISMNSVHETVEGYRFYLSNISTPSEECVKRIQLVVNYDPAKYMLTYPGGGLVALGIALLFFRFRDRRPSA